MGEEVKVHGAIVEFATVVTLDTPDSGGELSVDVRKEIAEHVKSIGLVTKGKSPQVMCEIIENNKIIFTTRNTRNR